MMKLRAGKVPAGGKKHEWVRAMILERHRAAPAGTAIPPEIQLAEEFGVSRVTVARALNDLVREGVLNRQAGRGTFISERRQQTPTQCIGVLCSQDSHQQLSDPFYGAILSGIQDTLIADDYSVMVMGARNRRLGTLLSPEDIVTRRFDGLIIMNIMNPEYFVRVLQSGIPIVGVEYHFEEQAPCDYFIQSCEESHFEVARKLIDQGHRRIAFIGHSTRNVNPISCPDQNSLERLAGIRRAFQSAGMMPSEDLFFQPPHPHWSSIDRILEHIFSLPQPPTAIFCEAGGTLASVNHFLVSKNTAPNQMPICVTSGPDGQTELGRRSWRISEDWVELGRLAARRMIERINNPDLPHVLVKLPWRLDLPQQPNQV